MVYFLTYSDITPEVISNFLREFMFGRPFEDKPYPARDYRISARYKDDCTIQCITSIFSMQELPDYLMPSIHQPHDKSWTMQEMADYIAGKFDKLFKEEKLDVKVDVTVKEKEVPVRKKIEKTEIIVKVWYLYLIVDICED